MSMVGNKPVRILAWSTAIVIGLSHATAGCRLFKPGSGVLAHQGVKIPGFESASTPTQKAVSGALAIGEDMISDLGTNLSNAGLALQEVDAVKAGAKKELVAQVSALIVSVDGSALRLAEDAAAPEAIALEIAGGSVVKGAVGQLGNINNAPAGSADIASARATLTGTIVSSSFNSIASATASIGGNATSAAAVAAVAEIMVGSAVASLNAAGLSGSNAAAGAKAVTAAAVSSLANPTLSAGAPDTVAKAMMQSTVASLAKVDVPSTALQSVISEATSGAVGAMSKTGLDTTATISVVGAIAGGSVAGLKTVAANLSLSADAVASAVQGVTTGATSGLKAASINANDLAAAASNIAGESVKALGTAGFASSTVSAAAGAVAAGAIAGLSNSGISAADLASNGVLKEVVKSTVANLGKTALESSAISSTVGLVVGNAVAGLSGANSADTSTKQSLVADVVKGAVSGASGAGASDTNTAATTLNSITQSATSSLVKAGFTAAEVASTTSSVAGAAVSAAVTSGTISSENLVTLTVQINSGVASALGTLSKAGVISESQLTAATSQVAQSIITNATTNTGGTQFTVDSSLANTLATATSNALTGAGVDQTVAQNVATSVTNAASNTIANIPLPTPNVPPTVAPGAAVCLQSNPVYRWNVGYAQPYPVKLLQAIYTSDGMETAPASCVANDALPAGLSVDSKCQITGSPTTMTYQKSFGFTATLANGAFCNFSAPFIVMPFVTADPYTDYTKPQITGIEFLNNDTIVDSSSNNKPDREVTIKISGDDNLQLMYSYGVYVSFKHSTYPQSIIGGGMSSYLDYQSKSYTFAIEFPLGTANGGWNIDSITIQDTNGNSTTVFENDVSTALRPFFSQVVTNNAPAGSVDLDPPTVAIAWAVGVTLPVVDSANQDEMNRDVFPQFTVTDPAFLAEYMKVSWVHEGDVAGTYQIQRDYYLYPSRSNPVYINTDYVGGDLENDPMIFPYGAPGGLWRISAIDVEDLLGNRGRYRLAPESGEQALPSAISALRIHNTANIPVNVAPTLTNLVISAASIDAGVRDAKVPVALTITDDFGWLGPPVGDTTPVPATGVQEIAFRHSNGMLISMSDTFDPTEISASTSTLLVNLELPILPGSSTGVYTFDSLRIVDGSGHTRIYKGIAELHAAVAGAPTSFVVTRSSTNSDGDSVLDEYDECPTVTAPANRVNGCPDPYDLDNDLVMDTYDKCLNSTGSVRYDGCTAGEIAYGNQDPPNNCILSYSTGYEVRWDAYPYSGGIAFAGNPTPSYSGWCSQIFTGPKNLYGESYVWQFRGMFQINNAGIHTFKLTGDPDDAQIIVNGSTIVDCAIANPMKPCTAANLSGDSSNLTPGEVTIEVRVRRGGGTSQSYELQYIQPADNMLNVADGTRLKPHTVKPHNRVELASNCGSGNTTKTVQYTFINPTLLPALFSTIVDDSGLGTPLTDFCSNQTIAPGATCDYTLIYNGGPLTGSDTTDLYIPLTFAEGFNNTFLVGGTPTNKCP